jgi:hypothetical protein
MNFAAILLFGTSVLVFVLFALAIFKAFSDGGEKGKSQAIKTVLAYVGWMIFVSILGFSGLLSDFTSMPPKMMIFFVLNLTTAVAFAFSSAGTKIIQNIPIAAIVGFQSMRILVELGIWRANAQGLAPIQMTFEGYNFDIVTGILSLILIPVLLKNPSKKIVAVWSVVGVGLLITILTIAILSLPLPIRVFLNDPHAHQAKHKERKQRV